jgi:hypothetical protein
MRLKTDEKIKLHLHRRNLTLVKLGKKIGLKPTALYNRIAGHIPFSKDELNKLKAVLGDYNV